MSIENGLIHGMLVHESAIIHLGNSKLGYDQILHLPKVPEYLSHIPSTANIYISHCAASRFRGENALHGDVRIEVDDARFLDEPDLREIISRLGLELSPKAPRTITVEETLGNFEMSPFPNLLFADPSQFSTLTKELGISRLADNWDVYRCMYALIHAAYDGQLPHINHDLSYGGSKLPIEPSPYTALHNRLKRAKRILGEGIFRRISPERLMDYFDEKQVLEWIGSLPMAQTRVVAERTLLQYVCGAKTYQEFYHLAREGFPGQDFGTLGDNPLTLSDINNLQSAEIHTPNGLKARIGFSGSTAVCSEHRSNFGLD